MKRVNRIKYFLIAMTVSAISSTVWGYQYAVVQKSKAIIYADQTQSTPIGYITKGKKVKVGEVLRRYGTILPIAMSGKVAYIKRRDLTLTSGVDELSSTASKNSGTTRRSVVVEKEQPLDLLSDNNYIIYSYRPFIYRGDWNTISVNESNSENSHGVGQYLAFMHRSPLQDIHFGFSFGMSHLQQETLEIGSYMAEINFEYALINNVIFSIELLGGVGHSMRSKMLESRADIHYTANISTFSYGAQLTLFPHAKFTLGVNYTVRALNFYNLQIADATYRAHTTFNQLKKVISPEFQFNFLYRF